MIGISINNNWLELGDIKITLVFKNPIFSKEIFVNSFSYNFSIPTSEKNRSIFENNNRINAHNRKIKYDCVITYDGSFLVDGLITLKEITDDKIILFFSSKELDLFKSLKELDLKDLNLEETVIYSNSDTPTQKQQKWFDHLNNYIQYLSNNRDIELLKHHFPPILVKDIYSGNNNYFFGHVNYYDWAGPLGGQYPTSHGVLNSTFSTDPGFKYTFSPCPVVIHLIKDILQLFGYSLFENDFLKLDELKNLIIYSANVTDNIEDDGTQTYNVYTDKYQLQNFLPDIKSIDLFKIFTELYKCSIYIEGTKLIISPVKNILSTETEDLTNYCNPYYKRKFVEDSKKVFTYLVENNELFFNAYLNNQYFDTQFDDVTIGDSDLIKKEEFSSSFGRPLTTIQGEFSATPPIDWRYLNKLALNEVLGKSNYAENYKSITNIFLGVYRGYIDGYPVFSNITKGETVSGGLNSVFGKYSLLWDRDDGIIKNWWAEYNEYLNSEEIEKTLYLPIHKVKEMATFKTPVKSFYHKNGNVKGIITELSITLSKSGISTTKAKFKVKK